MGGASSIEPHAELRRIEFERYWSAAKSKVNVELYRCKDCSTPWVRQITDDSRSGSLWRAH